MKHGRFIIFILILVSFSAFASRNTDDPDYSYEIQMAYSLGCDKQQVDSAVGAGMISVLAENGCDENTGNVIASLANANNVYAEDDDDCVFCGETARNVIDALFVGGSLYTNYAIQKNWSNAYKDIGQAKWDSYGKYADAIAAFPQECTNGFNSWLDTNKAAGMGGVSADGAATFYEGCGKLFQYAGYANVFPNSYGGYGSPWGGAGYSNGFLGGMMGPYYGGGQVVGGFPGGYYPNSGFYSMTGGGNNSSLAMLAASGLLGSMLGGGGISIQGSLIGGGGYIGGYPGNIGGYITGGIGGIGGYPGYPGAIGGAITGGIGGYPGYPYPGYPGSIGGAITGGNLIGGYPTYPGYPGSIGGAITGAITGGYIGGNIGGNIGGGIGGYITGGHVIGGNIGGYIGANIGGSIGSVIGSAIGGGQAYPPMPGGYPTYPHHGNVNFPPHVNPGGASCMALMPQCTGGNTSVWTGQPGWNWSGSGYMNGNMSTIPWNTGNGSYWNNTGGWNNGNYNSQYNQWQNQYQNQQQMNMQQDRALYARGISARQGAQLGNQGLYENYLNAGADYYGRGTWTGGAMYGSTPYAAGNLSAQFGIRF